MGKYKVYATPSFDKDMKKLKKRYPKINKDFKDFLNDIEENGDLGDEIPGVIYSSKSNNEKVYKKRMANTSANKGARGGFRIIEYVLTDNNEVYFIAIYSKNEMINMQKKEIGKLVKMNKKLLFREDK